MSGGRGIQERLSAKKSCVCVCGGGGGGGRMRKGMQE